MKHGGSRDDSPAARLMRVAADHGVVVSPERAGVLVALLDRLALEPQNLTAIDGVQAGVDRHLADSLVVLGRREFAGPVCDVGSGGGFPGLVVAILVPEAAVTLVESETRKGDWLRRASGALPNVRVVTDRSETLARREREAFRTVTVRAVAAPVSALELAAPLVQVGGHAVLWTSRDDADRARDGLAAAAPRLGFAPPTHADVAPFPDSRRRLLVLQKTAPCPDRYPRRPGVAVRRPIA